ncbi:ATP synthase F1 subunit delta [Flavitalea flava]
MKPNPRLAARYAKSLIDLSVEKDQLEAVYTDMLFLKTVCANREFANLLQSPVISADKKGRIFDAIIAGKVSELTALFNKLLLTKGREAYLPEIVSAFIQQYKDRKGIFTVKLSTASPVSEELKNEILDKIRSSTNRKNLELITETKEALIGGFVLEIGDQLVDNSIAFELKNIRKQFQNNDFIYKIR